MPPRIPGGSRHPAGSRGKPPFVFDYRCALCAKVWPITAGDPKAGLCPLCCPVVSPETRGAIGRLCSENPRPPGGPERGPERGHPERRTS